MIRSTHKTSSPAQPSLRHLVCPAQRSDRQQRPRRADLGSVVRRPAAVVVNARLLVPVTRGLAGGANVAVFGRCRREGAV